MLDFAKLESDKIEFSPVQIDVRKWMDGMAQLFRPQVESKRIDLQLTVAEDLSTVVLDELRLTQVASTILSNALKFTREEGTVKISAERDGPAGFVFEVSDSGIGIAEDDMKKLFVPFQQLSEGLSKAYEGLGLSLTLARRLVEAQGGSIEVRSKVGVGSTFTIRLPTTHAAI